MRDVGEERPRFWVLDERQQGCFLHLDHRALRVWLKPAHRFDLVAEELNAVGPAGIRREDIQDAAAHRVLAGHLDRLAALVADALQMGDDVLERDFFSGAEGECKLAIEVGGLGAKQGGSDRRDGEGHALGGQAPQTPGALLADLGVRREALPGQDVESGHKLRVRDAASGNQQLEEGLDGFGQRFGFAVAVHDDHQRPFQRLPQQHGVESLGRGGEAGEAKPGRRFAFMRGQERAQKFLERGVAPQPVEEISDGGVSQSGLRERMFSTIPVVE